MITEAYLEFCTTKKQKEILTTYLDLRSNRKTADRLGLSKSAVQRALATIRKTKDRQEAKGYAPEKGYANKPMTGWKFSRISRYDEDTRTWWIQTPELQKQEELIQAFMEGCADSIPRTAPVDLPSVGLSDMLAAYILTDYHVGMMAWGEETGEEDWDLSKSEALAISWFNCAVDLAPATDTAIFAQIGDFSHYDSWLPLTPTSKHVLDTSSRFQQIVRVVVRLSRVIIAKLLSKHQKVHVIWADANHDPAVSAITREMLAELYADEPRVTVDTSPATFYCYVFHDIGLFFHHGHKASLKDLDRLLLARFKEEVKDCKYLFAHTGHFHEDKVIETPLMRLEQHRTLAPPDAYSAGKFASKRDSKQISYLKGYGEHVRVTIPPQYARNYRREAEDDPRD